MSRRSTEYILIHCSASPPSMDIGVERIREWHLQGGYDDVGYQFVIRRSGAVEEGRSLEAVGAHCRTAGMNKKSIGICLIGGVDEDGKPSANFTEDQMSALRRLLSDLTKRYPGVAIWGHGDVPGTAKACPCFSVSHWLVSGVVRPVRGAQ